MRTFSPNLLARKFAVNREPLQIFLARKLVDELVYYVVIPIYFSAFWYSAAIVGKY